MFGQTPGFDLGIQQLQQSLLYLGNGFAFYGGCRGIGMSPSTQACDNIPHVDFGYSTAGHDVNLIFHLCDGKYGVNILHLNHFMNQKSKVGYILVGCYTGEYHLDAVDRITVGCLDHIVQDCHLLRADFPRNEVGYHVEVGTLGKKKSSGRKVFFRGGWKCERACVFVNAKAHDGGLVGGNHYVFTVQNFC